MTDPASGGRNLLGPAVLSLLAGGLLAFFSLQRTWETAVVSAGGMPDSEVMITGSSAYPVASALSIVLAGSALGVLAATRRTRRFIGALTLIAALAAAAIVIFGSTDAARLRVVSESMTFAGTNEPDAWDRAWWPVPAFVGWLAAAGASFLIMAQGHRWPTMGRKYEAPGATKESDDDDLWKAFDEGRDPTQ